MNLTLEELVEFYDARDLFAGVGNSDKPDVHAGFARLRASKHPEAVYVCSLFPKGLPENELAIKRVFLAQGDDPVALAYVDPLRSAELGNVFAIGRTALWAGFDDDVMFDRLSRAAALGDRCALYHLGMCYERGIVCAKDISKAIAVFKEAARLGSSGGMWKYAKCAFAKSDPERYVWIARAARKEAAWWNNYGDELSEHANSCDTRLLFTLGKHVKGYVDCCETDLENATLMVSRYEYCIERAQRAVIYWLLCARHLSLYKDVARLIAQHVWDERHTFLI